MTETKSAMQMWKERDAKIQAQNAEARAEKAHKMAIESDRAYAAHEMASRSDQMYEQEQAEARAAKAHKMAMQSDQLYAEQEALKAQLEKSLSASSVNPGTTRSPVATKSVQSKGRDTGRGA